MSALLLALALAQEADPVQSIVERLADGDVAVRNRAEKELGALPLDRAPALRAAARASGDAEVVQRVERSVPPEAWVRLLHGTVGEARAALDAIRELPDERSDLQKQWRREHVLRETVWSLETRVGLDLGALLLPLLDDPAAGVRDFALYGLKGCPPQDLSEVLRLLEDRAVGRRAADLLAASGDASVVPTALALLKKGCEPALRVLRSFGAHGRVKGVLEAHPSLQGESIAILARTAGTEAEDALVEALKGEAQLGAAEALARIGGPRILPGFKAWMFRTTGDTYWDHWLLPLGDAEWAGKRLDTVIRGTAVNVTGRAPWYASVAGPAAREPLLAALRDPAAKVGRRKELLPAFGVVALPEDMPFLASLLRDDRLVKEAGEALDMTGHPARARPMMEAFKKTGYHGIKEPHILALPLEGIEDDLVEILSDPKGYGWQASVALRIVARRPTPRLREALFGSGLGHAILAATACEADRPRIERLRASATPPDRMLGSYLALRLGDQAAAAELARLVFPEKGPELLLVAALFIHWPDPPGEAWPEAVEEAWRRTGKKDWTVERWLARRGVEDALAIVRRRKPPWTEPVHRPNPEDTDGAILARRGEAAGLERILERAQGGALPPETEAAFLAGADRAWKLRTLAVARRSGLHSGATRLAALLALPEGIPLYRAVVAAFGDPGSRKPDDAVTIPCLEALARLGAREAIPEIRLRLRDRPARTAAAAALALARLGDRDSLPEIAKMADAPDEIANEEWDNHRPRPDGPSRRLWHAAMEALEVLTGEKAPGASDAERRAYWRTRHEKPRDR